MEIGWARELTQCVNFLKRMSCFSWREGQPSFQETTQQYLMALALKNSFVHAYICLHVYRKLKASISLYFTAPLRPGIRYILGNEAEAKHH